MDANTCRLMQFLLGLARKNPMNTPGVVNTEWQFRQLHHGMFGVGIERFTEFCEHWSWIDSISNRPEKHGPTPENSRRL